MALRSKSHVDFNGGVVASTSRLLQPPNSLFRSSNFYGVRRGGLRTVDGSALLSSLNGNGPQVGQSPIVFIRQFSPAGAAAKLLALRVGANTALLDVTAAAYGTPLATIASTYATPELVPFQDKLVIAAGNATPAQLWDGVALSPVSNAWTAAGYIPTRNNSAPVPTGSVIQPSPANGFYYVAVQAGLTAAAQPAFPVSPNSATVVDGGVIWQLVGSTTADVPGAAHAFNHAGSLWLWGTGATDVRRAGPSALWMSDSLNPNSYNPLNTVFIGLGDGQTAQGGVVLSGGDESGIASSPALILFKDRSTYIVIGTFPALTITMARTQRGNLAPRTAQYVPELGGVVRFSHQGFALFTGAESSEDVVVSEPIRDYIWGASDVAGVDFTNVSLGKSALARDPVMYLAALPVTGGGGNLTRVFALDVFQKVWWIFDLPFAVGALNLVQMPNAAPLVVLGGQSDGAVRRWLAGDATWDSGAAVAQVAWSMTDGWFQNGTTLASFVRVNCKSFGGSPIMTGATFVYDQAGSGATVTKTLNPHNPPASLKLGPVTARGGQLSLSGSGATTIESIEYQVVAKPARHFGRA